MPSDPIVLSDDSDATQLDPSGAESEPDLDSSPVHIIEPPHPPALATTLARAPVPTSAPTSAPKPALATPLAAAPPHSPRADLEHARIARLARFGKRPASPGLETSAPESKRVRPPSPTALRTSCATEIDLDDENKADPAARGCASNVRTLQPSRHEPAPGAVSDDLLLPTPSAASSDSTPEMFRSISASDRFWRGAIKHSLNTLAAPSRKGASIAETALPSTMHAMHGLERAFVSTFVLDLPWVSTWLPVVPKNRGGPPITLVMHAPGQGGVKGTAGTMEILTTTMPNQAYGVQHIKLLLFMYGDRLRMVVSTGNLVPYDWSEVENTFYIHDFPLRDPQASGPASTSSPQQALGYGPGALDTNDLQIQLEEIVTSLTPLHCA